MSGPLRSVDEHLPRGEPRGCILVVSDYRPLNRGHAAALCAKGYAVYTAVTCTDVPRVFETFAVGAVEAIAFASLVHGWHHREAEGRPDGIPQKTDEDWQTRNMGEVIKLVSRRQKSPPAVLIAVELITCGGYNISPETLMVAGINYQTYSAGDPWSISGLLQRNRGLHSSPPEATQTTSKLPTALPRTPV